MREGGGAQSELHVRDGDDAAPGHLIESVLCLTFRSQLKKEKSKISSLNIDDKNELCIQESTSVFLYVTVSI